MFYLEYLHGKELKYQITACVQAFELTLLQILDVSFEALWNSSIHPECCVKSMDSFSK